METLVLSTNKMNNNRRMEEEYADAGDIDVKENYDPVSTGKECSEILSCCF